MCATTIHSNEAPSIPVSVMVPAPRQYVGIEARSARSDPANLDEDWTKISDLAERRRIQNRIAQRNYRKKLNRRLEDLERRTESTDDIFPRTGSSCRTESLMLSKNTGYPSPLSVSLCGDIESPDTQLRIVQSRPRPRCWEHGCNGRQFSTFSNLLRHQRERGGQTFKSACPNCGAEFTRTTARNGHLIHDKCKLRNDILNELLPAEASIPLEESSITTPDAVIFNGSQHTTCFDSINMKKLHDTLSLQTVDIPSSPGQSSYHMSPSKISTQPTKFSSGSHQYNGSGFELQDSTDFSTDSSSMLSYTENSSSDSEDDGCAKIVNNRKKALLDSLMTYFYSIFSSSLSYRSRTQSRSPSAPRSSAPSSSPEAQGTSKKASCPSSSSTYPWSQNSQPTAYKRRNMEEEDDEFPDGKRQKGGPSEHIEHARLDQKFACPFYRKDPSTYGQQRSCIGPGWTTVHRVKEHVYRRHALPISCPRCHETFATEVLKDEHFAAAIRCEARRVSPTEGMNATQKELLRSRKKGGKKSSEAEKWREMFLILFPDTASDAVPSPYYECSYSELNLQDATASEFNRYEQFLRRELPARVRQELESRIDERLNPIEESLRSELVGIVRDMQIQLFDMYKSSRSTDAQEDAISNSASSDTANITSIEDVLEPFHQPPAYEEFGDFDAFNGLLLDFTDTQYGSFDMDSGYGSLFAEEKTKQDGIDSCGGGISRIA